MRLLIWLGVVVLLVSGCDRPLVAPRQTEIVVAAPDLSIILTEPTTVVEIEAASFRDIDRIDLNDQPMTFEQGLQRWQDTVALEEGLNRLVLTAYNNGVVETEETVFAVYLPHEVTPASALPQPLGGHTATRLRDGRVLVTGGQAALNRSASAAALLLDDARFTVLEEGLRAPRTGHTASLLPDGRVLILGGNRTFPTDRIEDLVETAEVFDPATNRFEPIHIEGPPIRRTFHTAGVHVTTNGVFIDLLSGYGDIRYGATPFFGLREDLRRFEWRNDTLFALAPSPIGFFLSRGGRMAGHTQTPLSAAPVGAPVRHLVQGADFDLNPPAVFSSILDYTTDINFEQDAPPLRFPRVHAASARLADGYVVFFGGHAESPSDLVTTGELYVDEARRLFTFPPLPAMLQRFGHTATISGPGRILLLGGFTRSGNATAAAEYVDTAFSN